jgi:hypothetical protein
MMSMDNILYQLIQVNKNGIRQKKDYLVIYCHRYLLSDGFLPINGNQVSQFTCSRDEQVTSTRSLYFRNQHSESDVGTLQLNISFCTLNISDLNCV